MKITVTLQDGNTVGSIDEPVNPLDRERVKLGIIQMATNGKPFTINTKTGFIVIPAVLMCTALVEVTDFNPTTEE